MIPEVPELPTQVTPPVVVLAPASVLGVDDAEVIALPVFPGVPPTTNQADEDAADGEKPVPLLGPGAEAVADALGLDLLGVLEAERATGAVGEVVRVPVPGGSTAQPALRRVLLVGMGDGSPTAARRAAATLARVTRDGGPVATTLAAAVDDEGLQAVTVGLVLASFAFTWRSGAAPFAPPPKVVLAECAAERQPALDRALALADAGWTARFLATVPSNLKNPAWLAAQAEAVAEAAGLDCEVWDEHRLAAEGFGGIIGVGQGSATPPRMIRLDYAPPGATRRTPTVVLVGKGITFDSGGLSIKPGEGMVAMKRDMTGGAVVLATMAALEAVGCPVKVVGLIAAAENAVGGASMRPGDVLSHYGGRTTEVTNTDAEGRLVMADALAYAVEKIRPAAMLDVATLTGAMKLALGLRTGGFFASDDALADLVQGAAASAGEPLWRMPLGDTYVDKLRSTVADADNAGGGPGAITAALFLQPFTGGLPWAHLDIASVGDSPSENHEWTTGPTGWGARTLLTWLGSDDPLAGVGA
ncbi:leucyl aminopeptidase family protein [Nocardioides sp. GY 10127]|uniref:leucyl aminopeptidase family protein n=1 Tax=Nocardioides sp. GY 10127 TaxID=2569762 RepID=UPI0010A7DFE6|nr:leucyl aminopeptidase family protein [Nocardioides sp. GY 10127]TIC81656.1 leucyl aminopeptidase family protein [Nocardioides sp. GY 10127]